MRALSFVTALTIAGCGLLLSGCGQHSANAPVAAPDTTAQGTPAEQPGSASPSDTTAPQAQASVDDVTLGTEVAADNTIPADKTGDDFAPGQAVNLAMRVADAPANTQVKVIWFGPNDTKLGEDVKAVQPGEQHLAFMAPPTKDLTKGDYRAEVWVGDEKVNEQHFNLTTPDKSANAKEPKRG